MMPAGEGGQRSQKGPTNFGSDDDAYLPHSFQALKRVRDPSETCISWRSAGFGPVVCGNFRRGEGGFSWVNEWTDDGGVSVHDVIVHSCASTV